MDFTKQSGVKSSFCTAFAHRKLSLKSYSSFPWFKNKDMWCKRH
ncbi:hypothetical protein JTT01_02490 [Clostridium botulinum]|nr:hypothetical protein [Clostridium botulinum]MCS4467984.1 hypothetical protein [Clostridium botulinum]MCS4478697.1 hypothetical protein [Clostridium botulinum]